MPAYSDHTRSHIPIALSHDDDVEMIYETLQNNPDIEYAEIYVDTITSESWDDIAERVTEIGRTSSNENVGPSSQNEGLYNVHSDSSPPPSERYDSSDESEDVSTDDSDSDTEVAERQHMPPTEHYTMIGQPMYATTDMPEIPDIPYWDPSRDFSKGMIFQTKKDVQAALKQYALQ
ncbi:hypothetical protein LINPERHAP1_LOCUS33531, partial [Linum perenne]